MSMLTVETLGNTSLLWDKENAWYIQYNGKLTKSPFGNAYTHSARQGWEGVGAETDEEGKATTLLIKFNVGDGSSEYWALTMDPVSGMPLKAATTQGWVDYLGALQSQTRLQTPWDTGTDPTARDQFYREFDAVINPQTNSVNTTTANNKPAITNPSSYGKETVDRITNYNPKTDEPIQIDLSTFDGAVGKLKIAKKTKQVTKLAKKNIDFIYDQRAGYLYYNENGTLPGFGDGGIFAILEGKPKVGTGNFEFM